MIQEPKDFPAVVAEVLRQPLVGRIDFGAKNRGKKVEFQSRSSDLQTVSADLTRQASVTQVQGAVEDVLHGAWKTDRATGGCGENLLTAIQKMPQALLMFRVEELIVCRPTVMNHDARVIEAEECLRHRTTSRRVNDIGRRVRGHKTMQPGGKSTDTPTGLVGDDPGGGTHGAANCGINGFATMADAKNRVGRTATAQGDAKKILQAAYDLALRKTGVLVQLDHGGLSVGSQLRGGSAEGVGGL